VVENTGWINLSGDPNNFERDGSFILAGLSAIVMRQNLVNYLNRQRLTRYHYQDLRHLPWWAYAAFGDDDCQLFDSGLFVSPYEVWMFLRDLHLRRPFPDRRGGRAKQLCERLLARFPIP